MVFTRNVINTILEDNTGYAVLVTNSTCTFITSLLLALDSWNNGRHNYYYYYYYYYYYTTLHPLDGLSSRTTWVSRHQKGKTILDFTGLDHIFTGWLASAL